MRKVEHGSRERKKYRDGEIDIDRQMDCYINR